MLSNDASILVVDDEVDTCRNLSDILTDLGYHVDMAHDGPSALELVRRNAYDVALLDYKMPGMDGVTLYREIKKLRAGTVAIVITAYADSGTTGEALQAGVARPTQTGGFCPPIEAGGRGRGPTAGPGGGRRLWAVCQPLGYSARAWLPGQPGPR